MINLIFISLTALILLPIYEANILTWRELFRLFIILMFVITLYLKSIKEYKKSLVRINKTSYFNINSKGIPIVEKTSYLMALIYIYLLSQFNPSTASISRMNLETSFNPLNLYFISSTIISFIAIATLLFLIRNLMKSNIISPRIEFSNLDKLVLAIITGIIFVGALSNFFLSDSPDWENYYWGSIRILIFAFIWIFVRTMFVIKHQDSISLTFVSLDWIRRLYLVFVLSSVIILTIGTVNIIGVYSQYNQSLDDLENGEIDTAKIKFSQVLSENIFLDIGSVKKNTLINLAKIYSQIDSLDKFDEIIANLKKSSEGNDNFNKILGKVYYDSKKVLKAKNEFEQLIIKKQIYDKESANMLSTIYLKEKNIMGIIDLIEKYNSDITFDNLSNDELVIVGNVFYELEDYEVALEYYSVSLMKSENNSYVQYKVGRTNVQMKEYEKAIENFKRSLQIDRKFADAIYLWGICLEKLGDTEGAITKFEETLKILPNHYNAMKKIEDIIKD